MDVGTSFMATCFTASAPLGACSRRGKQFWPSCRVCEHMSPVLECFRCFRAVAHYCYGECCSRNPPCQIRAALTGQAPAEWAIGAQCQAVYSADGEYYDATVEAVSESGNFIVVFDGYGNKEEVGGVPLPPRGSRASRGGLAPARSASGTHAGSPAAPPRAGWGVR